jgi:hypothetical protein
MTETECVYCAVRTGSQYAIHVIFGLRVVNLGVQECFAQGNSSRVPGNSE